MKKENILLIGGGLLLLYLFLNKKQSVKPVEQIKSLTDSDKQNTVLVSPLQQVTEEVSSVKDNSAYRVKYIAGSTHYI
jgi:hypothetical protein